ncbi:hypothetical protein FLL57_20835 [Rhodopseudomonas palustris]|uniref:hypothetical protein n=1 Tax=Rhodopseudomonas palustris TaxID=1076 RepID=UPI00115C510B|nr:hypothetical protein [Rhodopseudomonas palustris]QDL99604.1 hypothetical protein FLL57_20835 [Rhodopseudomonas palustris]
MKIWKFAGLAAIAGLLLIAASGDRAQAAPLATPGIATAVQRGAMPEVTEVQYRRHRHYHRHHPRAYRHHHVRRYYAPPRHYRHHRHHYRHHRHWR